MSTREVKNKVRQFACLARKRGFVFSSVYLFGSYAFGQARPESDIDVAVVVKKKGRDFFDREGVLWELAPEVDARIEPFLLGEDELKKDSISAIGQAVRASGVKVM